MIVFSVLDSLRDHCLRKQLTQALSKVAACSCTYEALKTSKTFPLNASSLFRHFSHKVLKFGHMLDTCFRVL